MPSDIQYDERGRAYIDQTGNLGVPEWARKRSYISPAAMHQEQPRDQGGIFHTRPTWNQDSGEYEQGLDWGNILSMVVAGTLTAGVATAMMGGGAEAAAAVNTAVTTGTVPTGVSAGASAGATGAGAGAGVGGHGLGSILSTASKVYGAGKTVAGMARGSGGSNTDSNMLTDVSQQLGGAAAGRGAGRALEGDLLLRQGTLANQIYTASQNAASLKSKLATDRASQAVRGDLIANMEDVHADAPARVAPYVTHFSGGARPSAFGPNARAAGAKLSSLALDKLGNEGIPDAPSVPELPQGGALDSVLATGAGISGILGTAGKYLGRNTPSGPSSPQDDRYGDFSGAPPTNQVPALASGGADDFETEAEKLRRLWDDQQGAF